MPDFSQFIKPAFVSCIQDYLDEHPEGVKEHDILCHLDEQGFFQALATEECSTLLLFRKHFLLFHTLYSINQQRVADKRGALSISPLLIKKLNHVEAGSQIGEFDALSEFYLDLSNLETANEESVNNLLDAFWEKFLRNEKRGDALKMLGLNDPATDREIVQRYRKLVSVHHPDKGGDKDKIQVINEAYAVLIRA